MMLLVATITIYLALYFVLKKYLKKDMLYFFIYSSVMGLIWEIVTADLWMYNTNQFTVFYFDGEEIPINSPFSWGIIFVLSFLLVEFIQKNIFKGKGKLFYFLSVILVMASLGYLVEFIGIWFGLWSYNYAVYYSSWLWIVPIRVWTGWILFGTLMLSTIKFYSLDKTKI